MSRLKLTRRTILRGGIGGTAVAFALPPLEAMFNLNGTAFADGAAIPQRMGIFFWGNGVRPDSWVPGTIGTNWTASPSLQPLQAAGVKEYVNVVSGTLMKASAVRGHHSGTVGILSGGPLVVQPANGAPYRSTFMLPSIDQVAANIIGKTDRFKSLELGVSNRLDTVEGTTLRYLSHSGPDSPNPPDYNPVNVYNRIFGMGFTPPGAPPPPVADATIGFRKSVMDVVLSDITRLRTRVGAIDRSRLDKHTDNVRTIENRLTGVTPVANALSCKLPVKPGTFADQNGQEMLVAKTKAMSDLLAMALACYQTRVFSMMWNGSVGSTTFGDLAIGTGHHQLTHDEKGDQPQVQRITVYIMQMFASMLQSLKAIPEGAGNVLDNCSILATTDTSDGRFHNLADYPILVAGRGGGFFRYPGIHYRSPAGDENSSVALLSVLRGAGTGLNTVGAGSGQVTNSCGAIEV
jgi:hypothetical protein